jgi:hypothetical protein
MQTTLLAILALGVSPSGGQVPENLLRIELSLARPLSAPLDMRHVALFDGAGKRIDGAFLDLALPDRSGRNFAILMHPGRIKRGVGPNLALGAALHEGEVVKLVIDDPRLAKRITKTWKVVAAHRAAVAPGLWKLAAPAANGRQPLAVTFAAPLNASAARLIAVATSGGQRLPGRVQLGAGETEWRFVPSTRWRSGEYELRVHPSVEDPAGNRLCAAFEERRQSERRCDAEETLRFRVSAR